MKALTLYDRLWNSHVVVDYGEEDALLYIDRQLLHEVSSPQAFAGLEQRGLSVRRPECHLSVADHAVPTRRRDLHGAEPMARRQVELLERNAARHHIQYLSLSDRRQGIVHVVGPEQGITLPGTTLVCGDSHTSTHGAFGALAFGIGATECECVLATQTLRQRRARNFSIQLLGEAAQWISAKDVALSIIGLIGAGGATGYAIEYRGEAVSKMSMAARMTLCNMSIEAGARTGMVAPDDTTFASLEGTPQSPHGAQWEYALDYWRALASDPDASFQRDISVDISSLAPQVTWGTSPDQVLSIDGEVPDPNQAADDVSRQRMAHALEYMGLTPGVALSEIGIDNVFIGSCTNGRIEDLRTAAEAVRGKHVAKGVQAIVVPGSGAVKLRAEQEGLDRIFLDAGFEWRFSGCSLCVAMNGDRIGSGKRCASTSNRNFEGRQGVGARTHLMSPAMAAAAAVCGHLVDVRQL